MGGGGGWKESTNQGSDVVTAIYTVLFLFTHLTFFSETGYLGVFNLGRTQLVCFFTFKFISKI